VMSVSPVTIPPSRSVQEAHTLMQQRKIRHLPVLQDGCLVGIVSDRDLRLVLPSPATSLAVWELRHLLEKLTVGEMMTCFVMTTAPDCFMTEAVGRMLGYRVGALPVVEDRRVVGILTRTDVLRAFRRISPALSVTACWKRHRKVALKDGFKGHGAYLGMTLMARCVHGLPLVEARAPSLPCVSCTHRCSGQGGTATFLLRFP